MTSHPCESVIRVLTGVLLSVLTEVATTTDSSDGDESSLLQAHYAAHHLLAVSVITHRQAV